MAHPDIPAKWLPNRDKLAGQYASYTPDFVTVLARIEEKLKAVIKVSSTPTYKSRVKSFPSYYRKLLRTLPKVLKFLPSDKAADARTFMMSFQYWLGGTLSILIVLVTISTRNLTVLCLFRLPGKPAIPSNNGWTGLRCSHQGKHGGQRKDDC